jgi:hypothetical protein
MEVTKEYSSASSLKKPFKTPCKVPVKIAPQDPVPKDRQLELVLGPAGNGSTVADQKIHTCNQTEEILDDSTNHFRSCQFLLI